ncbi:sporulation protein [Streptomyces sp. HNM0574]|uniref:sporulation protein n=1 Tax=Streptomyces sp. HNM0574 TaxID=2714954 RepID=UPI00146B8882|nr:sporulation protein [Streptomyces sp. HNM0574]NLU67202.1 sporulation protein [Streptomyces sp. HNM0574]
MVFGKLFQALGRGGPSVDTVLQDTAATPGGTLEGQVHLEGGSAEADVRQITLELVARVEAEGHDGEERGDVVFERFTVGGGFRLAEGERRSLPFGVVLPWETPVTQLHGQPLGIVLGVRTEVELDGAKDKGDLDALAVGPLPVQEAVLEALGQLGFGFASADLELGTIHGTGQRLPFYQEIELTPPPRYAQQLNEVELTFLAHPGGTEVVLEADKRGGLFSGGHDTVHSFTVRHEDAEGTDWNGTVDGWLLSLLEQRAPSAAGYAGHHAHGSFDPHHGHGAHQERSGPGVGTAVAAGAAGLAVGVAGGLVAAEVVDEIGDAFEDDEEDEDEE